MTKELKSKIQKKSRQRELTKYPKSVSHPDLLSGFYDDESTKILTHLLFRLHGEKINDNRNK